MPRSYRLPVLISCLAIFSCSLPGLADHDPVLKGKVVDQHGNAIKNVKITCYNIDNGRTATGSSDGKGHFSIEHRPCNHMSFKVTPPLKTSLTSAYFENVSGDSNKQFIVQLHRGFFVKGKITGGNKGLKGLKLKFVASDKQSRDEEIHGGAETTTDGAGNFFAVLTPGHKQVEICNTRYPEWQRITHIHCQVTDDIYLPEIKLNSAPNSARQ